MNNTFVITYIVNCIIFNNLGNKNKCKKAAEKKARKNVIQTNNMI